MRLPSNCVFKLFLSYLLRFLRPWLLREWRREIKEEISEEADTAEQL
jgi:hypothetical protein